MKRYDLTSIQWNALADWFLYYLKPEERERFGASYPEVYNALCGTRIVRVVSAKECSVCRGWNCTPDSPHTHGGQS